MPIGLEGWIEYDTRAPRFNETERRQIGDHAVAAVLYCQLQLPREKDEDSYYDRRMVAPEQTKLQLYLREQSAGMWEQFDTNLQLLGNTFENSFDEDMARRLYAARCEESISVLR